MPHLQDRVDAIRARLASLTEDGAYPQADVDALELGLDEAQRDAANGFTACDLNTALEIHETMMADPDSYDGPETAMFSWGYGEVWLDGDVYARGAFVLTVNTDI